MTVGTRDVLIVFFCEFLAQCSRVDALLADVETHCGLTQSPSHVGIQPTTINIEVVIVLARLGSSHTANQLIVILEIVIIELRRNLPGLLLVVQTQVERSHTVVCFLILVVVFGTVESVGTIALGSNTQLGDDVETLVVREREIAVALSLLEVAVLRAAIRALVASAYGISLSPLARFKAVCTRPCAPKLPKLPPSTFADTPSFFAFLVTILMAPLKAEVPNTRDAAPSSTSMWSMSARATGNQKHCDQFVDWKC